MVQTAVEKGVPDAPELFRSKPAVHYLAAQIYQDESHCSTAQDQFPRVPHQLRNPRLRQSPMF